MKLSSQISRISCHRFLSHQVGFRGKSQQKPPIKKKKKERKKGGAGLGGKEGVMFSSPGYNNSTDMKMPLTVMGTFNDLHKSQSTSILNFVKVTYCLKLISPLNSLLPRLAGCAQLTKSLLAGWQQVCKKYGS